MANFAVILLGMFLFSLLFGVVIGLYLLGAWLVMIAWNFALVPLFHAPIISFWQAVAIKFLSGALLTVCNIVFGNKKDQ